MQHSSRAALALVAAAALSSCGPATSAKGDVIAGRAAMQPGNPTAGAALFRAHCAACHGPTGEEGGVLGPSLRRERERMSYAEIASWIEDPEPPMPQLYPNILSGADVRDLAAYVNGL
jgi:mono/diheme cytochrome c family protein